MNVAGIFSCTPSFSHEINKVYLILSYLISVMKMHGPMLLALREGGWVLNVQKESVT